MLATISGSVDQELLLRNEYLVTENRILKNQIKGRLQLTDPERISLAEIGQRLGRKALEEVAQIVRPETILGWHRRLVAKKFDGSKNRSPAGRPNTDNSIEKLILKMARENRSWGYRRIVGALSNLGYEVSHQTVGNVLERHGLLRAPDRERKTSWREFIRSHTEVLAALDFFSAEVWKSVGLITYHVLRAGVHARRITPSVHRRDDSLSRPGMDEANGPEHDHGGHRVPLWLQIPATRSRYKVLHSVRRDPPSRRYQSGDIAAAESKSERPLRTLDSSRKGRAPVENDSFWRKLSPPLP